MVFYLFEVVALESAFLSTCLFNTVVDERMRSDCDEVEDEVFVVETHVFKAFSVLTFREGIFQVLEFSGKGCLHMLTPELIILDTI